MVKKIMAGEKHRASLQYTIYNGVITGDRMTDWQEKTLGHWDLINRLARRRFADQTLAEEAALAVMDKLRANDWQALRAYAGLSSFATFVATLTVRLLEDFARVRYGRVRPPQWIRSLGGIWLELFRLLCLERMPLVEAVEFLLHRRSQFDRPTVENAACAIRREVVDCGKSQGQEVAYDDEMEEHAAPADAGESSGQQRRLEEAERLRIFSVLFEALTGTEEGLAAGDMAILSRLRVQVSPEDKLLLKLCFRDGVNGTEAAAMLGYTRFQLHGRLRRLMARIRGEFERAGLSEELLLLLRS
ncbi:MAG: hypothetical protein BWK76_03370 [Desulfobulbaceae bacterium A2]|nr:MAG: hypothetical protein BWK76_03370 [Desulfobulbaceae bacterium A2]